MNGCRYSNMNGDSIHQTLPNVSPLHERRLTFQVGAFGKHSFTQAIDASTQFETRTSINGKHFQIIVPPDRTMGLRLPMRRFVPQPAYQQPGSGVQNSRYNARLHRWRTQSKCSVTRQVR